MLGNSWEFKGIRIFEINLRFQEYLRMPEERLRSAKEYLRNHWEYGDMLGNSKECIGILMNM